MRIVVAVFGRMFVFDIGFGVERVTHEEPAEHVTVGESQEELALEDKSEDAELKFGFQAQS